MSIFFLSSGLFLGWSLGANDASNVFGTAVGSRMLKFRTAAIWCSIFIVLGAAVSGAGPSRTLGKLGSVNAIAGAFTVALAAAISVYLMTSARYPVSTSQAIVGAIIGWNLFSGSLTNYDSLTKIVMSWVVCPILAAGIAIILYKLVAWFIMRFKIHMFTLDTLTRYGLILVGAFGSYSLGANNIANVMGVFVSVSPFPDISIYGLFTLTSVQLLYLIGAMAIAFGVLTYSKRVMMTIGRGIMDLSPIAAFVVVLAHSIVLFLFASQRLESWLISWGLPPIPLVPVSSSQAIVGAIIGVGLLKGGRSIHWQMLGGIASSWIITPVIAAIISFISLFFMQNVFQQQTYRPVKYMLTPAAIEHIREAGESTKAIEELKGKMFPNAISFKKALSKRIKLPHKTLELIVTSAEICKMKITEDKIAKINTGWITLEQKDVLKKLIGRCFVHKWMLDEALAKESPHWRPKENDRSYNNDLKNKLSYLYDLFQEMN
ncbi:inorganic phosphate transporter [bacterium]|nr:inorganic phosphate transporter [bacterium]